jgi:hypothetical protein
VPVWVVRVGDQLFARSWRGQAGTWYRHARQRPGGRVRADAIDQAYQAKYGRYGGTTCNSPRTTAQPKKS